MKYGYKLIMPAIFMISIMAFSASAAFLCPVVGDGVLNAPGKSDDVLTPPVGTSFLPGNNQAGVNANSNAFNEYGPDNPDAGPGHNPDFSPIWP